MVLDTARVVVVAGSQRSEGKARLSGSGEQRCPGELGVVVDRRAPCGH